MKNPFGLAIVSFATVTALIVGICIAPLLTKMRANKAHDFLPPMPLVAELSVTSVESTGSGHVAARHFSFRTKPSTNAQSIAEVAKLFNAQLTAAGWEKMEESTNTAVAVSSWHHKDKIGGGLYLLVSMLQLDPQGQYFGTMEAVPFWKSQGEVSR